MSGEIALAAGSLFAGKIRAYFAPVDRADGQPVSFDPGRMGRFDPDAPPLGWVNAGVVVDLKRDTGSGLKAVRSGSPATVKWQARAQVDEVVQVLFPGWTRLAMALSAGTQTMNLLKASGASSDPSGGAAIAAEAVGAGSTATVLQLASSTGVRAGDVVAVDADYAGATGYIGSGGAGAYVASAPSAADVDFARRVSFNVARVLSVSGGVVTLAAALPAGIPADGMKVSVVEGFTDRNGGAFVPEWSALFVMDGFQGDRLLLHYPRLQPAGEGAAETATETAAEVWRWRPQARMRALPVIDALDGTAAVCFRTYLPAPMRMV